MIYAALIAAQFVYLLFPSGLDWAVGWNVNSLTIATLCFMLWIKDCSSVVAVLGLFSFVSAVAQWFGVNLYAEYSMCIALSIMFAAWGVKQATLPKITSDPISNETYMYGLGPVDSLPARLNVLRPRVWGEYGSRVIRAGEHMYIVHHGMFKKVPIKDLSKTKLELYTWVDSGVKLNPSDSSVLDNKLKERFIIFVNDCSGLHVSRSLGYILLSRFFNRVL